jgi:thioredoxin 1
MTILKDENFEKEINTLDKLVLVDFFATWCGPCQVLGPILEKLSENFKDKIIFMKADLDDVPMTAQKFNVEKIPTVILFKNGKPVSTFVGLIPEESIKKWLENILDNNK